MQKSYDVLSLGKVCLAFSGRRGLMIPLKPEIKDTVPDFVIVIYGAHQVSSKHTFYVLKLNSVNYIHVINI